LLVSEDTSIVSPIPLIDGVPALVDEWLGVCVAWGRDSLHPLVDSLFNSLQAILLHWCPDICQQVFVLA